MNLYSAGVVAKATDTPLPTIQRYKQQGLVRLQSCDVPSSGSGDKCGYSERRAIQIALVTELNKIGVVPSRAAKAAFDFSDNGNLGRAVGQLYQLGTTYLIGLPDEQTQIVTVPPDLSIADLLPRVGAAFVINCNQIVATVIGKLETQ